MGLGNDPDDYGLPPVDVEIPDDASELERDVQAYRREQRQRRRERRLRAVTRPLLRYGPIPPLVAAVLVIVAAAATLMTVLAPQAVDPVRSRTTTAGQSLAPVGRVGGRLPAGTLRLEKGSRPLNDVSAAVLLTVPRHCRCETAIGQIAWQARKVPVTVYLVAADGGTKDVEEAAEQAGTGVVAAEDAEGVLDRTYHPAGLSAVLVHTDGVVGGVRNRLVARSGDWFLTDLRKLAYPGAGAPALGGS